MDNNKQQYSLCNPDGNVLATIQIPLITLDFLTINYEKIENLLRVLNIQDINKQKIEYLFLKSPQNNHAKEIMLLSHYQIVNKIITCQASEKIIGNLYPLIDDIIETKYPVMYIDTATVRKIYEAYIEYIVSNNIKLQDALNIIGIEESISMQYAGSLINGEKNNNKNDYEHFLELLNQSIEIFHRNKNKVTSRKSDISKVKKK